METIFEIFTEVWLFSLEPHSANMATMLFCCCLKVFALKIPCLVVQALIGLRISRFYTPNNEVCAISLAMKKCEAGNFRYRDRTLTCKIYEVFYSHGAARNVISISLHVTVRTFRHVMLR